MDERYLREVEACGLFGEGICEICGKKGSHPECEARMVEAERKIKERDADLLEQHSLFGAYGIVGPDSQKSFVLSVSALQGYLRRPLECDLSCAIEASEWWYIPEGWFGMIGFIVEKSSFTIYPLGSGLVGRCNLEFTSAHWCGIIAYLEGHVEPG